MLFRIRSLRLRSNHSAAGVYNLEVLTIQDDSFFTMSFFPWSEKSVFDFFVKMFLTYLIPTSATGGFIFLSIIGFVIYYIIKLFHNQQSNALEQVSRHSAVAKFDVLGENNLLDRLASRARPNQRLILVFGINNSFTTMDQNVHKNFTRSALSVILRMSPQNWLTFFTISETALNEALRLDSASQDSVPLAVTVRFVVFAAMTYQFFDVNLGGSNFADVVEATNAINNLWEQSKNIETIGPELRNEQDHLEASLRRLLPNHFPCSSEQHPLNTIIPAYETMWRVVLLTYVSAGFRDMDLETTQQFQEVIRNIPECFNSEPNCNIMDTAINFAKEGLRLYPPTKRIHRAVPNGQDGWSNVKADVEWCHRERRIWGPDAEQFRPSRFRNNTEHMDEAYMPFGAGKHKCPTSAKFSYHAIIILVVALAKRLGTRETGSKVVYNDPRCDGDAKGLLPSGRKDMDGWVLEMNGVEWLGRAM
ncbi:uncharacterized protein F4807DRAFT_277644 [Annulohypoxylon truncatum]|uniref:uncharacterized protein n=1 Tax=Annulohypoxylon truncatum TaxID=327061 RepID=UPI00200873E1|nr:uncharacterized protein F4807DRAFT_277644 [Annulohypoxylon truncatum]KAI1205623.1 hypothetical protein F4807DRAFT_277644 [Annulohypoxylon truncatum]